MAPFGTFFICDVDINWFFVDTLQSLFARITPEVIVEPEFQNDVLKTEFFYTVQE